MSFRTLSTLSTLTTVSAVALLTAACGGMEGELELDQSSAGLTAITETVVVLLPDGDTRVTVNELTPDRAKQIEAEHADFIAGRRDRIEDGIGTSGSGIVAKDSSCAGASLWLYDGANQSGNRICFYGSGYANLDNFLRTLSPCGLTTFCRESWARSVRSLWAGADKGMLSDSASGCRQWFAPYQRANADACGQAANLLGIALLY